MLCLADCQGNLSHFHFTWFTEITTTEIQKNKNYLDIKNIKTLQKKQQQ